VSGRFYLPVDIPREAASGLFIDENNDTGLRTSLRGDTLAKSGRQVNVGRRIKGNPKTFKFFTSN
jgi:hypothetical protein